MAPSHTTSFAATALFLLAGATLSLVACLTPPGAGQPSETASSETAAADTASSDTAPASSGQPTESDDPLPTLPPREFSRTSKELIGSMKLGWNLGNALDAPESETAWGNPTVRPGLLKAVAKAGFQLVRVPVTWTLHTGPGPEFTVDAGFLERVAEIVGYVRDAGMHAIINIHHDGADGFTQVEWLTLNDASGAITDENNRAVRQRFVAVWQQIAKHFAGFGEELLFESMNEIHDGYGQPNPKYFTIINDLNQAFVDTVRRSGGNNAQRHLIVPGYNTNIDHTLAGFQLPKDPTPNRLIVSAHYYDPYLFALQAKKNTWGSASPGNDGWGQEDFVVKQFDKLKERFLDKGVPMIIGEYGATHQADYVDYRRYYMEYVTKVAVDRGIVPVYWDNGGEGSGGEKFGMFSRHSYEVLHPKVLEAMVRAATKDYALSDVALPKP
jgi:aryl-phospho-beta-D-glucosidase BglC (GH1 family)